MTDLSTVGVLRINGAFGTSKEHGRRCFGERLWGLVYAEANHLRLHDAMLVQRDDHSVRLIQNYLYLRVHVEEIWKQVRTSKIS